MTIPDLQAQRDQILTRIGITRQQFGDRSAEFSDAKAALALVDSEISKLQATAQQAATPRTSYVQFSDD